jgi:hypothetical protein
LLDCALNIVLTKNLLDSGAYPLVNVLLDSLPSPGSKVMLVISSIPAGQLTSLLAVTSTIDFFTVICAVHNYVIG